MLVHMYTHRLAPGVTCCHALIHIAIDSEKEGLSNIGGCPPAGSFTRNEFTWIYFPLGIKQPWWTLAEVGNLTTVLCSPNQSQHLEGIVLLVTSACRKVAFIFRELRKNDLGRCRKMEESQQGCGSVPERSSHQVGMDGIDCSPSRTGRVRRISLGNGAVDIFFIRSFQSDAESIYYSAHRSGYLSAQQAALRGRFCAVDLAEGALGHLSRCDWAFSAGRQRGSSRFSGPVRARAGDPARSAKELQCRRCSIFRWASRGRGREHFFNIPERRETVRVLG